MERRLSPQAKKRFGLECDRRNGFGQSDKASRRLIPLRKAKANRAVRRLAKAKLASGVPTDEHGHDNFDDTLIATAARTRWRKHPDASLIETLGRKQANRIGRTRRRAKKDADE